MDTGSWREMIAIMKGWIDENVEDLPSLPALAKRLGYSPFYASAKFREIEGRSYREYVAGRKIQRAAADLYQTAERTVDIAVKYGYSSQEAFTRAFARVYGTTPAAYRRMGKPTPAACKSELLAAKNGAPIILRGGRDMKLSVKQMYDWNYYAYCAEEVEEQYWPFFRDSLWWQLGTGFIKSFDNVKDFAYCAENFAKYGETSIKQQLKLLPSPWEAALDWFLAETEGLGADWYIHGSAAMALWGIEVAPRGLDVIFANYSDFEKVREHFCRYAIEPIQRCDNWVMSGLGGLFHDAVIGLAFHNRELEPYDMGKLAALSYRGREVHVSTLAMLRQDNENMDRSERVKLIEERMKKG